MSCDPKLLIADEPTTAIDVTTQAQVLSLLRDLQQHHAMAIIFITHDLGVIAQIADFVVVMYLGRVVETGPVDDIFHRPQHPYTRALLAVDPEHGRAGQGVPADDRGLDPAPVQPPARLPVPPALHGLHAGHLRCGGARPAAGRRAPAGELLSLPCRDGAGLMPDRLARHHPHPAPPPSRGREATWSRAHSLLPGKRAGGARPRDCSPCRVEGEGGARSSFHSRSQGKRGIRWPAAFCSLPLAGEARGGGNGEAPAPPPPILEVRHLKKYFPIRRGMLRKVVGVVRAVDDVSFTIAEGETLGLVGESGCGKTTTARCILRALDPSAGEMLFRTQAGAVVDVAGLSERAMRPLRREMQMIFQDPYAALNPRMNLLEIVGEPLLVIDRMTDRAERTERDDARRRLGPAVRPADGLDDRDAARPRHQASDRTNHAFGPHRNLSLPAPGEGVTGQTRREGDELTSITCAMRPASPVLPEDIATSSFLLGLGIALDDSTILARPCRIRQLRPDGRAGQRALAAARVARSAHAARPS